MYIPSRRNLYILYIITQIEKDNHNIHTSGIYIIIIRNTFCKRSQQLCKNRRHSSRVIMARKIKTIFFLIL